MKKLFSILCSVMMLVAACFTLAGCGGSKGGLTVWYVSGKENKTIMTETINRYKEANPGAVINIVEKPSMDVFNAFKYALNDDRTRPDVAIVDHVYIQSLAHDNLLTDMSSLGADDIKSKYPEGLFNANIYNDKVYGLPLSANTIILMYNEEMLRAAKVTKDGTETGEIAVPNTLDELYAACEKVKGEFGENRAFAQPFNTFAVMQFMSYVGRLGGKIVSDDYKTVHISTDPKTKTAVQKWKTFIDNGYANKLEFEEGKFYNGQIAFIEMGSWNIAKVSDVEGFTCGYAEMVSIDDTLPNYSGLGLYSLVVPQKSQKQEEAYKFAEFLSTDLTFQLAFNKNGNVFAVTNEALNDKFYTENPILAKYASQMQKIAQRPGTPVWPDMEQGLVNMLREATLNGNVDSALNAAQISVQAATDRLFK